MGLLQLIAGILTGKAGEAIGGKVARAAEVAAIVAALAPVALWLNGHRDEVFISVTYGELAVWGGLTGGLLFVILRLVHRAPPPG